MLTGADPRFSVGGGANPPGESANIQICQVFPKNCMKLRKFWSVGGRPPLDPPLVNCELGLSHEGCKKGASAEEEIKAPIVKDSSEFVHYFIFCLFLIPQGELTITSEMENLSNAMFLDTVPESWVKRAYPSLYGLTQWYADLLQRIKELESWVSDFQLPNAVWLAGFFNPQSFLTAIMQQMARKNEWPLDKMALQCGRH